MILIRPLHGPPEGEAPGWSARRVEAWLRLFLGLGLALRLVRLGLNFPLWRDEAYVAANLIERDFAGLLRPLDDQQVCPIGFLWAEEAVCRVLGFHEWSLRLLPTLASIAALFLFRRVAGRLIGGPAPVVAVAFLAVGYTPIRHGGEVKPYATDLLFALGLIGLAVDWLREPGRTRPLWLLAALGPLAVGLSNPAVFVVATVGLVLAVPALRTRSVRVMVPLGLFAAGTGATFLWLLREVNGPQAASVMDWMRVYWAGAFPPRSPLRLLGWLAEVHTGYMFAYPAGGARGASGLTTTLVVVGAVALGRRGSRAVLGLLLAPFALGLVAAALGRYPYGGSARTMQYVAPSILLLAGLGAAVVLTRLVPSGGRERAARAFLGGLFAVGLGMIAWDLARPYKEPDDRDGRDFARRFWAEESAGAELVDARADLRLPISRPTAMFLAYREFYAGRSWPGADGLDRVTFARPLRLVVFNESTADAATVARWIEGVEPGLRLAGRRERVRNRGRRRGKLSVEERYAVYELVPAALARQSRRPVR